MCLSSSHPYSQPYLHSPSHRHVYLSAHGHAYLAAHSYEGASTQPFALGYFYTSAGWVYNHASAHRHTKSYAGGSPDPRRKAGW